MARAADCAVVASWVLFISGVAAWMLNARSDIMFAGSVVAFGVAVVLAVGARPRVK